MNDLVLHLRGFSSTEKENLKARAQALLGRANCAAYVRALIRKDLADWQEDAKSSPLVFQLRKESGVMNHGEMKRLELRLTINEYHALKEQAEALESSANHYLVALMRACLTRHHNLLGAEINNLKESNYQLAAVGNNLNQIARAINAGKNPYVTGDVEGTLNTLRKTIKRHLARVARILHENLERWDIDA